jgi:Zn finger protein HypA/HybF involved in hydrogenase expression
MQLRGTGVLDTSEVKFECPWCQRDVAVLLGDVRWASNIKCELCQTEIAIKGSLETAISQIETAASGR